MGAKKTRVHPGRSKSFKIFFTALQGCDRAVPGANLRKLFTVKKATGLADFEPDFFLLVFTLDKNAYPSKPYFPLSL